VFFEFSLNSSVLTYSLPGRKEDKLEHPVIPNKPSGIGRRRKFSRLLSDGPLICSLERDKPIPRHQILQVEALAAQAPEVDLLEVELKSDNTLCGLSAWHLGHYTSLPSSLMLRSTSNLALHFLHSYS